MEHNLEGWCREFESFLAHQKPPISGAFRSHGTGFRGSETWEVWLVKQRLFGVFDAADRISLPALNVVCAAIRGDIAVIICQTEMPGTPFPFSSVVVRQYPKFDQPVKASNDFSRRLAVH